MIENGTIEYYKKSVYGKTNYYILDRNIARLIYTLTGTITVSVNDLRALKELGFQIVERISPTEVNFEIV